jgi:hypothetical protein
MKKELEHSLAQRYPNLYRDLYGDKHQTLLYHGLAVDNGWYHLIDELSSKLEALIELAPEGSPEREIRAVQIKEKFGGLRFYLEGQHHPQMSELIHEAENQSMKICETCGAPGERRFTGWVKTLCEPCHVIRERQK